MFKKLRKNEKRYPCPVCGFHLEYPPDDFNICPSCGVEFGYETASRSFYDLRREWINTGAPGRFKTKRLESLVSID
jgi:predicted RNA-binding Zn-ribbon protein involved in translation (DUF1610 family)